MVFEFGRLHQLLDMGMGGGGPRYPRRHPQRLTSEFTAWRVSSETDRAFVEVTESTVLDVSLIVAGIEPDLSM